MGAGIFHLSYDPGPRCFSLSVRVLWSWIGSRILLPLAVASSCFSHVLLRLLGLAVRAVRAMERIERYVLVPCLP